MRFWLAVIGHKYIVRRERRISDVEGKSVPCSLPNERFFAKIDRHGVRLILEPPNRAETCTLPSDDVQSRERSNQCWASSQSGRLPPSTDRSNCRSIGSLDPAD